MSALVLAHGWGLEPSFWDAMGGLLADLAPRPLAPGDWSEAALPPAGEPCVAVGHSLGLLWLLHRRPSGWAGLVGINAFTRFTRAPDFPHGVAPRVLERMRARLAGAPEQVHVDFLRRCGHPAPEGLAGRVAPGALARGLEAIATWDVRGASALAGPFLALASRQDPILPEALSRAAFAGGALEWHEEGGHLLPLSHPEWCARHVRRFVEGLARGR